MKQTLYFTRGLPGSGKTTFAVDKVDKSNGKIVRIERDLLRDQLYNSRMHVANEGATEEEKEAVKAYVSEREQTITTVQFAMAEGAVRAGKDIIISDTNLRAKYVKDWMAFAHKWDLEFEVIKFDDVTVDECVRRDKVRKNSIGEKIIRDMAKRFLIKGKIPDVVPSSRNFGTTLRGELYTAVPNTPKAIIVDIDGTLAKMGDRSPYDWSRVGEDESVEAVVNAVKAAYDFGREVIVMSGRDGSCRDITIEWLLKYLPKMNVALFMRKAGDSRADNIVKLELFDNFVRKNYDVEYVLDDRDQVVRMWRSIGLPTFQVAEGAF
jgi:predicted kinase